jgi:hypothetical protein
MVPMLFAVAVALPVVGGVVLLVRRMLRSHALTEKELEQLEREQRSVEIMQLPTLTTEGTAKVARDTDFEMDANIARMRGQGF